MILLAGIFYIWKLGLLEHIDPAAMQLYRNAEGIWAADDTLLVTDSYLIVFFYLQPWQDQYNKAMEEREMKVKIEMDESLQEEEVIIRCREINEKILRMQAAVTEVEGTGYSMALRQGDTEYYLLLEDILFFETENKIIYAHTRDKMLETGYKLYELEELLPSAFLRISKSAIVNLNQVYSITRNLTSSSLVEFMHSHKRVYVSRNYYKMLVERLAEKRKKI